MVVRIPFQRLRRGGILVNLVLGMFAQRRGGRMHLIARLGGGRVCFPIRVLSVDCRVEMMR